MRFTDRIGKGVRTSPRDALIAAHVPPQLRGKAFGWFHLVVGICALPASVLFGLLWKAFGAGTAFAASAGPAVSAALLLLFLADPTVGAREPENP